jgi:hypothetical protein
MKLPPSVPGIAAILLAALAMPMSASADKDPDPFWFSYPYENLHPGGYVYSNRVTITGIDEPIAIGIEATDSEDAGYSIGCTASFTGQWGTILNGQDVCVRHRVGHIRVASPGVV